jgi:uncharacterized protein YjiS (DUF1127 family)
MFLVIRSRRCDMDRLLPRRLPTGLPLARFAGRILQAIMYALERSRQRRALAAVSDAMLRDIGLTRAEITEEIEKPFWR